MNKQEFINRLNKGLSGLPQKEREERITFYSEMIDDRVEDGMSEEEAVVQIGNVDDIISQAIADVPMTKLIKERVTQNRKLKTWEIVLLAIGLPLWLPLLIAGVIVLNAMYIVLCALSIALWAIFVAFAGASIYGIIAGSIYALSGFVPAGLFLISLGILSAGLSIFVFYGCKVATKGCVVLAKKVALKIKKSITKKEDAKNE